MLYLTIAVLAATAAPAQAGMPSCGSGHTMARSDQVRVFGHELYQEEEEFSEEGYRAYACYLPTRKVRKLGNFNRAAVEAVGAFGSHHFVANGRFVAWEYAWCDREACRGRGMRVLDMRTGDKRAGLRTRRGSRLITDLVLKRNGSIAWVRPRVDGSVQVWRWDRTGETMLDAGTDIEPDSLTLEHRTLFWLAGGSPRSAFIR